MLSLPFKSFSHSDESRNSGLGRLSDSTLRASLICWMRDHARVCSDVLSRSQTPAVTSATPTSAAQAPGDGVPTSLKATAGGGLEQELARSLERGLLLLRELEDERVLALSGHHSALPISGLHRFDDVVKTSSAAAALMTPPPAVPSQGAGAKSSNGDCALVMPAREKLVPSRTYRKLTRS